jgi:pyruvate dehydrogenase E2 component (dihydrolipoamide acetyltransferase)
MATEIIVPKVDMVMETATFVEWLKQEGEPVRKGEPLFVIQTDKSAIEVEAPESGILAGISASADDVIPVSSVIGYILIVGESLPVSRTQADPHKTFPLEQPETAPTAADPGSVQVSSGIGIRATPLARSLAKEKNLDLSQVQGSGPLGRIYRADVERYSQKKIDTKQRAPIETSVSRPFSETDSPGSFLTQFPLPKAGERKRVALKGARAVIAQRLSFSAQTIPHIHINIAVDMSEAARLRDMVKTTYVKALGHNISFTAIIAHAVVRMLNKHPSLNSSLVDDQIIFWDDVHLGIAADLEDSLVVPVIRDAQTKKLDEIGIEIRQLVEKAKARKLLPAEMSGSTFTISNLGMMGAVSFTAIINPPETAILAVGKISDIPVALNGALIIRPMMNLNLAVDHRVTDGAEATRFLSDLKAVLENPYLLL